VTSRPRHTRNRQGEGIKLREEILAAAGRLLESTGNDDAVTLRAVAREAGITAPAIYAHFADRGEILRTVVELSFTELAITLRTAAEAHDEPVDRLRAVGRSYLEFAVAQPNHYRMLFERHRTEAAGGGGPVSTDVRTIVGADAFGVLLDATDDCIRAKASTASAAAPTATRIWIGLHGQATLQASLPWFPWPDSDQLADDILTRLADLASRSRRE
jgi:AcrR family transcriptional regulator